MRSVFATRFQNATLEGGAPLLIVAVREPGLHALAPSLWKSRDQVAGVFFKHWEHQYALVRLDTFGDLNQAVVFHEYTHSVLHANLHWLPTWLDEGLAEFYAYTRFQGDHIYVGAPSVRLKHLQEAPLIPISEMLSSKRSITKDAGWTDRFYGEAWAMVHLMTFGPQMEGGAKLYRYIALLQANKGQLEAFQEVFGPTKIFEEQLAQSISKFAMTAGLLPPAAGLDAKSFPARVLTRAESDYEVGSFDIGVHDTEAGKALLQAAETADPALAGPHEELGFLLWHHGEDAAARAEWTKAVAASESSYRAGFALLMSGTPLRQQEPQQLHKTEQELEALHAKAPKYAPIVVELALVQWRLGQLNQSYKTALMAEKLEPWRAGYQLLLGDILLAGNQPKLAADYARLVADRWPGADHDQAVELWNRVPAAMHGDLPAPHNAPFPDATLVRGTIVNSSCEKVGEKNVLKVELQPLAPDMPILKLASAGPYESGFADTLWVGEDHYTSCFHLAGLPAVVGYRANAGGPPRLEIFQVREDLPTPTTGASPQPHTEAKSPISSEPISTSQKP